MLTLLRNLYREENAEDLLEYCLVALIVCLGAIAGMGTLANSLNGEFTKISSHLT